VENGRYKWNAALKIGIFSKKQFLEESGIEGKLFQKPILLTKVRQYGFPFQRFPALRVI